MTLSGWTALVSIASVALFGVGLPACAARMIVPALTDTRALVRNYRGADVPLGLSLVWLAWAIGLLLAGGLADVAVALLPAGTAAAIAERFAMTPLALPLYGIPFLLVAAVAAIGMADDHLGGAGPKGFHGHLRAARDGRLTTGMFKLVGVGALALFYGASAAERLVARGFGDATPGEEPAVYLLAWASAAAVIALSANLFNLLDLRPGRALKSYLVSMPVPAVFFALAAVESYNASVAAFAGEASDVLLLPWEAGLVAAALVVTLAGPALAVMPADLRERAMLGDAGANVLGAIVGYLLTAVLSLGGIVGAAVMLAALNALSERVSFSAIIERTPLLRAADEWGRRVQGAGDGADQTPGSSRADADERTGVSGTEAGSAHDGAVGYHAREAEIDRRD